MFSVLEARRGRTHPERLSPSIAPPPFDAVAWQANRQDYLDVVEPGRVYQSLTPAEGIPVTRARSPQFQEVVAGGSVILEIQTAPDSPATFTAFDGGRFINSLTSITVASDGQGLASAELFIAPTLFNDLNVLVSSPQAAYQVHFIIIAQPPDPAVGGDDRQAQAQPAEGSGPPPSGQP